MPYVAYTDDGECILHLKDGKKWTKAVLDGLENANWHTARETFKPLLELLPEIWYELYHTDNVRLAEKLEHSTKLWSREF